MKFISLEVENWGPYQDVSKIEFAQSSESPVTIIYGENGKGKTSLFEAIWYGLYGRDLEMAKGKKFQPEKYANRHKILKGTRFAVSVTLTFDIAENRYESFRRFFVNPKGNNQLGFEVEDESWYLKFQGEILSDDDARARIRNGLPKQISRFFLFDGEDLKNVLDDLNTRNETERRSIKFAINSLLGLPSLEKMRDEITKETASLKAKIEGQSKSFDKSTKQKNEIDKAKEMLKNLEIELKTNETMLLKTKSEMDEIEPYLNGTASELIGRRKELQKKLSETRHKKSNTLEKIRLQTVTQWFYPLEFRILDEASDWKESETARASLSKELSNLTSEFDAVSKSVHSETCYVCHQHLTDKGVLKSKIESLEEEIGVKQSTLAKIKRTSPVWNLLNQTLKSSNLKADLGDLREIEMSESLVLNELDEIQQQLKNTDDTAVEDAVNKYKLLVKSEQDYLTAIEDGEKSIAVKKAEISRLESKYIAAQDAPPELKIRHVYYSELIQILNLTIEFFREAIKSRVEEVSSKHYVDLIENQDILGLKITNDYQVNIVHKDIGVKESGSFGQNLLLVYAFIGALTDVSGNDSGLVVDTPIARLDLPNQERVWRWLSNRGRQVIVFPHSGELTPTQASKFMGTRIGSQYEIYPLSADAWSEIRTLNSKVEKNE